MHARGTEERVLESMRGILDKGFKLKIYIAGPLGSGPDPVWINANTACRMGTRIADQFPNHLLPIVPHTSLTWAITAPPKRGEDFWIEWAIHLLDSCQGLLLAKPMDREDLVGGTLKEVEYAEENNIPWWTHVHEMATDLGFIRSDLGRPINGDYEWVRRLSSKTATES